MGQTEAMEAGTSPEEGILSAAKTSTLIGYEILKAHLPSETARRSSLGLLTLAESNSKKSSDDVGQQDQGVEFLLESAGFNFTFEDAASWPFPAFDEIPWASNQWKPSQ